ncbi:Ret3 protein [Candida orthopsilosis Co 90-125]|uniref:Coatomer subunit zeta n=1 Tax=Candida orthopsilosis (strain 90-125) TaxID=1136231 RepID=H8WVW9_CANO9|nr:Ret3 protein [Candida orthopsilosis Co 90-125]CCG20593.1 Ret3 protein [Candida orthopsilosis Co 90-125]
MSLNTSLYTVSALLILDNEGNRLYAKYYTPPTDNDHNNNNNNTSSSNPKTAKPSTSSKSISQLKFEKSLFSKINKVHQDILLYDNNLIVYKQINDASIILVAPINENECLMYSTLSNLVESLTILLNNTVDKATIIENYDLVVLAIDETIDDGGIILEYDPATIVSRVTNAPVSSGAAGVVDLKNIDLSEKGLFNALSFAGKKLGERFQQGL